MNCPKCKQELKPLAFGNEYVLLGCTACTFTKSADGTTEIKELIQAIRDEQAAIRRDHINQTPSIREEG